MSTAATKTFSVTKTLANVHAMQKYNEEREVDIERASRLMEKARLERLDIEKKREGKLMAWAVKERLLTA